MTVPCERYRALIEGMRLIENLLRPQITPRVSKSIREQARRIMRHYPTASDFERIAQTSPDQLSTTPQTNGNKIK
jgi:hypothetical protein